MKRLARLLPPIFLINCGGSKQDAQLASTYLHATCAQAEAVTPGLLQTLPAEAQKAIRRIQAGCSDAGAN